MVLRRTLLTIFIDLKMSSQLTSLVAVLDGTNYQQWAATMQSYLMSQGQWKCVKLSAMPPTQIFKSELVTPAKGEDKAVYNEWVDNQDDIDSWYQDAEKALGNIRLRLHHTIGYQYTTEENPSALWATLKEKYGSPGVSRAYIEFKGAMDTVIPNGSDPHPALDKMLSHFVRLKEMDWEVPEIGRASC